MTTRVHQVVYSDNYIAKPQYRHVDAIPGLYSASSTAQHQQQSSLSNGDCKSVNDSRASLDSNSRLLDSADKMGKSKTTSFSFKTWFGCCCFNESSVNTTEKGEKQNESDSRWSSMDGNLSSVSSQETYTAQARGKPDGKEMRVSSSVTLKSQSVSSYESERRPFKPRYSGSDFDVIDLAEGHGGKGTTRDGQEPPDSYPPQSPLEKSAAFDLQDKRREMFGRQGFRDSVFNKLSEF